MKGVVGTVLVCMALLGGVFAQYDLVDYRNKDIFGSNTYVHGLDVDSVTDFSCVEEYGPQEFLWTINDNYYFRFLGESLLNTGEVYLPGYLVYGYLNQPVSGLNGYVYVHYTVTEPVELAGPGCLTCQVMDDNLITHEGNTGVNFGLRCNGFTAPGQGCLPVEDFSNSPVCNVQAPALSRNAGNYFITTRFASASAILPSLVAVVSAFGLTAYIS
mmetsp:Transcript_2055/g.5694  ORF Transcript_2055/g.5694 Transcript_2055/m.5694 type:complete len:215 (+) Transcript_2055:132-776(+)|eukprot:CAMPEP_0119119752 /NCGR_PEP_ID=MMETSP1310-20130426/1104_1 /TAXON_ID=464262 /ORGANISM="Genus nov. species nov., Strain RCC2339" /LENGTH=214 /DNA_ID=CAMNT_0007109199 /DNA_START=115 /DNA_END=759 /DNA_ORIENTATION=+